MFLVCNGIQTIFATKFVYMRFRNIVLVFSLMASSVFAWAQEKPASRLLSRLDSLLTEEEQSEEMLEHLRNMPNIEVGKGISFEPQNKLYKMTMRFRMQNMLAFDFDDDFSHTDTEARVKRLRLRFDGYIFSPKLLYSIQLGFTPYDAKDIPNGNVNIVRDAMVYYMPNDHLSLGFGQTKIKANRARVNSSSALQFVDRSIVNSEFNLDRDFGFFAEYYKPLFNDFNMALKGSITLGEGRNWSTSDKGGFAYTGRVELFPLGRFKALGDVVEGDFEREEKVKFLIAGAYSFNNNTTRLQGQNGEYIPNDEMRNLHSYFVDFILKYNGFAFYTDFMGRKTDNPLFTGDPSTCIYTGNGLNIQTSYLFPKNWEIALRNSTLFPDKKVQPLVGYKNYNQTTIGVTRYLIGHSLKVQADASYNHQANPADPTYNRWEFRFQVELGL